MSIRRKIFAYQGVVAFVLLGTAAATYVSIERIDYYFDRSRLSREQMDTVIRLSAHMNRYSENIAEMLLLGRTELDDFQAARSALEASFEKLQRLVEQEIVFVRSAAEREEESEELLRVETMLSLYRSIDRTAYRLMSLRDLGREAEAVQLFRDQIENRLDEELEQYIGAAILDKERQLEVIEQRTNQLEGQLTLFVLGVCLAGLAVSVAAGAMLAHALIRPIKALISGARAIGEGDLSHRIEYEGLDEFAELATQCNVTAARLEAQRVQLLEVQSGLETEVERRTRQLEDANDRLQRLDHMRMLFLADIGHELRTPLTVIRGEAEVALRGDKAPAEHRETLRHIVQITGQMGRLVEDLLFLSRAEVGAVRFEMQRIGVQEVLDVAVGEGRVLAAAHGLLLDADMPAETCAVLGDAGRLVQALLIVLDNAVKYSDAGACVDVALTRDERNAVIAVRNRGVEVPAADLPFVFNRFYRGRHASSSRPEGSGLGLSIAKWIIDTHGGRVGLTSARRETVVTIHLPLSA